MGRTPLSRDKVLRAAVAYADAHGIESLSMRTLATEVGLVPMALYKHVADKEDLLDGMVDLLVGEFARPEPASPETWQVNARRVVMSAREVVQRHPWARRVIETRTTRTPTVLGHMEAVLRCLLDGGLSVDLAHHAMHALGNRIWGFSPELFNAPAGAPEPPARPRTSGVPDPGDYPSILAVAAEAQRRRPGADGCDEDFEFGFALDLILDGIDRLHRDGWTSGT
ncbi:MAG TPA: TetR/AcrR family transcriptional regulator [Marmoricola sp.]|nr:TetR/AcrR family transcriptional regulator [Marmoricola sp.]